MRKLEGMRVVITRAAHQAEELARPLRALGAEPILVPVIGIAPPLDPKPLKQAAARPYDWIIFTSTNAVKAFSAHVADPSALTARIAVVGASTERAAREHGFSVNLVPEEYVAESLLAALANEDLHGRHILIPSADDAREVLPRGLRERGAAVDIVVAYRNVLPEEAKSLAPSVFREPFPDWVTFASPSAVKNLVRLIGTEPLSRVRIISIGPVTSAAVRRFGLSIAAEAGVHSMEGLIEALQK
ncbi:MAG TPA: uroporphyrinogen-III synthase [Bryobacteraceae bacterium]